MKATAARPVTDRQIETARSELAALETELAEHPAMRAAVVEKREQVADLEARQAEQERAAVVGSIRPELDAAEVTLKATRDATAAAAAGLMASLAAFTEAAEAQNAAVAVPRSLLESRGLSARPGDREGVVGSVSDRTNGVRVGGTDWLPVVPEAVTAYIVRALFFQAYGRTSPLASVLAHRYRPEHAAERRDGLAMPAIPRSFGLTAPPAPVQARAASAR